MASITSAQRDQLTSLFITMFDAAPGVKILGSLVGAYEAGASLADIAAVLATKPQFKTLYPNVMSAEEVADRMVATLLPDETRASAKTWAKNWVVERLTNGDSIASVMVQAAQALTVTTNANFAAAKAQLANKLAVANYFSIAKFMDPENLADGQKVLEGVTQDPDTVEDAKDQIGKDPVDEGENPGGGNPGGGDGGTTTPPPVGGTTQTISVNVEAGASKEVDTTADRVTLNLKVIQAADIGNNGSAQYSTITLDSDAKELTITLTPSTDNNRTSGSSSDDVLDKVALTINASSSELADLVTVKLSGNGKADITNSDGASLVYIDASGLASKTIDGKIDQGLTYISDNSLAETIILGSGKDTLTLTKSTVGKTDVVTGLNLVDDAGTKGTQLDAALSDGINVGANGFAKITLTSGSLNFALIAAAKSDAGDQVVFQYGGNTYIYADTGTQLDSLDDEDMLIKLVGTVNLDLLLEALNS